MKAAIDENPIAQILYDADLLAFLPGLGLLISLLAALFIFPMRETQVGARTGVNLGAAALKVILVLLLFPLVFWEGVHPEFTMPFLPGFDFVLRVDELSLLFASLSAVLWLLTTVYAIGYLGKSSNQPRFFGFFSLCVMSTVGISFSGNLVTFLVFYEMLTLSTYPLVAHSGTKQALRAARTYLIYAMSGGLALLIGVVALSVYAGPVDFASGGSVEVDRVAQQTPVAATVIFFLLIAGLGVKAALVPLHGWLPKAMVAPTPVSALLHAVAVVKAGVFGIVRIIDDVYGIEVATELGVLAPLAVVASITIIYGSVMALRQADLKRRLAYSTVSQLSYVVLGISLATVMGTAGGLVHVVHQGIMKITLFFCAGLFMQHLGVKTIDRMNGLGTRLPVASITFTIAAFGMIGLPPTVGFITKWHLGIGALASDQPWTLWVLISSTVLNAMYFLPVVYRLWFHSPDPPEVSSSDVNNVGAPTQSTVNASQATRVSESKMMSWPVIVTASAVLGFGIVAAAPFSPLSVATEIARGVFNL